MSDKWESCTICGSTASTMRADATRKRTVYLCRAHSHVCIAHLKDPCLICDGGLEDHKDKGEINNNA